MDVNDIRGLATILCMAAFLLVVVWAYAPSRRRQFDEAANLPFEEDQRQDGDQ